MSVFPFFCLLINLTNFLLLECNAIERDEPVASFTSTLSVHERKDFLLTRGKRNESQSALPHPLTWDCF